ncbi:MAG: hypothetical protein A2V70_18780 [Planctomycetes bacterium RBG_13_63_9]|nr:MAG: hypothetical protein A2V70_18780 [Planctomycetes bacterium RBG_13_63_9]
MDEPPPTRILIHTRDREAAVRWRKILSFDDAQVWLDPAQIPPDGRPDLILTDSADTLDPDAGVVRIGEKAPADVRLPYDATDRELRLACKLLGEIVRLRRRQRSDVDLHRRLSHEAMIDPLTGLPNRRAWDQTLGQRLAEAANTRRRLCLAILDLDHFKRVNDSHGLATGDDVLRATARALADGLRQDDFVARLGGDEFGLLLWVPDESSAQAVVDRVRTALPSHLSQTATPVVHASAGYYVARLADPAANPPPPEAIYALADWALRQAKHDGRDRTLAYTDPMGKSSGNSSNATSQERQ